VTRSYQVILSNRAARELRSLPLPDRRATLAALDALVDDPRAGKPLVGQLAGVWSLRRGDFRILYRLDDDARRVEIARIAHRRDVYRRR